MSTFFGLETARRAMNAHQSALYTTGNNISNANTQGYSRQRVNFAQTEPFPNPGMNAPRIPGQLGTGVTADFVQRIREGYLDTQYRGESSRASYWETSHDVYTRIEDLLNEPSKNGVSGSIDRFWQSLQDLADNPGDEGARSVVKERGVALADTFNYIASSLEANKKDVKSQIDTTVNDVNSLLRQIQDVNEQISRVVPHGHMPNKLYDDRDVLLDELSGMMNIEVEVNEGKGQALPLAQGTVNVYLLDEEGNRMTNGNEDVKLVNGEDSTVHELSINFSDEAVDSISFSDGGNTQTLNGNFLNSPGKVSALVEGYGYNFDGANGSVEGIYPELMNNLDKMVSDFATEFNKVHSGGYGLDGSTGKDFFTRTASAGSIKVHDDILSNLDNIAAANTEPPNAGDGKNALDLADAIDSSDVQGKYQGIIGNLAVETMEAGRMKASTANLRDSINSNRQQVSSVSLDEEMTNLIQFQHAYNAAARNITAVDEMLDRIINNMGLVGR